jgi:hypothetical protein
MALRWTNSGKAPQIVSALDELTGLNEQGEVTLGWTGKFEIYLDLLAEMINFSPEVPRDHRTTMTRRAVVEAKKGRVFTSEGILAAAGDAQSAFLRLPKQDFVLIGSISVTYGDYLRAMRIGNARLRFLPARPQRFSIGNDFGLRMEDDTPSDYSYITARISSRNPEQAGEEAFEATRKHSNGSAWAEPPTGP